MATLTKQTVSKLTDGKALRKQLATKASRVHSLLEEETSLNFSG
jgi:hypothetical protein